MSKKPKSKLTAFWDKLSGPEKAGLIATLGVGAIFAAPMVGAALGGGGAAAAGAGEAGAVGAGGATSGLLAGGGALAIDAPVAVPTAVAAPGGFWAGAGKAALSAGKGAANSVGRQALRDVTAPPPPEPARERQIMAPSRDYIAEFLASQSHLPRYANGGIAGLFGPELALLGEAGPELVRPIAREAGALPDEALPVYEPPAQTPRQFDYSQGRSPIADTIASLLLGAVSGIGPISQPRRLRGGQTVREPNYGANAGLGALSGLLEAALADSARQRQQAEGATQAARVLHQRKLQIAGEAQKSRITQLQADAKASREFKQKQELQTQSEKAMLERTREGKAETVDVPGVGRVPTGTFYSQREQNRRGENRPAAAEKLTPQQEARLRTAERELKRSLDLEERLIGNLQTKIADLTRRVGGQVKAGTSIARQLDVMNSSIESAKQRQFDAEARYARAEEGVFGKSPPDAPSAQPQPQVVPGTVVFPGVNPNTGKPVGRVVGGAIQPAPSRETLIAQTAAANGVKTAADFEVALQRPYPGGNGMTYEQFYRESGVNLDSLRAAFSSSLFSGPRPKSLFTSSPAETTRP